LFLAGHTIASAASRSFDGSVVATVILAVAIASALAGIAANLNGATAGQSAFAGLTAFAALIALVYQHMEADAAPILYVLNGLIGLAGVIVATVIVRASDHEPWPRAFVAGGASFCAVVISAMCVEGMIGAL
jgi:peptidoglycan/LPS O-acetylase OafA/YrhL